MKTKISLILRYLSDRCSDKEKDYIREQIKNDPKFAKRLHLLSLLWYSEKKRLPQRDVDSLWTKMKNRIEAHEAKSTRNVFVPKWQHKPHAAFRPIFSRPALQYAFVFILIVGGSFFVLKDKIFFRSSHRVQISDFEIVKVDYSQRLNIELSDGTKIIADAGSEIKYPKTFTNQRDIYLKGEAYFEVAHDSKRPFYVHANHALVRVIVTKFNVRAWNENPSVSISVNEGKVAFSKDNDTDHSAVILKRNEMSLLTTDSMPTKPKTINAQDQLGWMKNTIKFNDATVEEVLAQLQRWYNYEFVIQDSTILEERLTVHILPTNVDDVLEVISLLTNTKIEKDSNRIQLNRKK